MANRPTHRPKALFVWVVLTLKGTNKSRGTEEKGVKVNATKKKILSPEMVEMRIHRSHMPPLMQNDILNCTGQKYKRQMEYYLMPHQLPS